MMNEIFDKRDQNREKKEGRPRKSDEGEFTLKYIIVRGYVQTSASGGNVHPQQAEDEGMFIFSKRSR